MPYDLEGLWDRVSVITYAARSGRDLRTSDSLEENASFLIRWGSEIFPQWATWMNQLFPGCTTKRRTDASRIVDNIKEMLLNKDILKQTDGWKK